MMIVLKCYLLNLGRWYLEENFRLLVWFYRRNNSRTYSTISNNTNIQHTSSTSNLTNIFTDGFVRSIYFNSSLYSIAFIFLFFFRLTTNRDDTYSIYSCRCTESRQNFLYRFYCYILFKLFIIIHVIMKIIWSHLESQF